MFLIFIGIVVLVLTLFLAFLAGGTTVLSRLYAIAAVVCAGVALSLLVFGSWRLAAGRSRPESRLSAGVVYHVFATHQVYDAAGAKHFFVFLVENKKKYPVILYNMKQEPPRPCFVLLRSEGYVPVSCETGEVSPP